MIDTFGLFVSHGLMLLAAVLLLRRPDLDREGDVPDRGNGRKSAPGTERRPRA